MMKKILPVLLALALLPSLAAASVTVTATQSGADSGSVMAGRTFTVTASGLGACTSAYLDLTGCGICSVSESQSKSVSGSSVSWTTVTAASKASSQSVMVSISGACTPDSGSASFDVKNPPSLSATANPSSVSVTQGSTTSFGLDIQNTGETTARFGTITASGGSGLSLSGCSPSDIAGGQSLGLSSCTITASSGATTGAQTLTLSISPTNADSITKTVAMTVSSSGQDNNQNNNPGGGSSGGGGGTPPGQQKKITGNMSPPGLVNNTKLQAAIEKVLAKGKMNQNAIDNLVRLSNIISSQTDVSRTITVEGNKSTTVKTSVKYKGAKTAKNYVVYEKVPKAFANTSSSITVTAPGAKVEVVEADPEYAIVFGTVNPNQELAITYTLNKAVATGTVDSFATEVYAESLEEAAPVCAQVITPAKNLATGECREFPTPCDVPSGWTKVGSCQAVAGNETTTPVQPSAKKAWTYYAIALIVIFALAYYFLFIRGRGPKYSFGK